MTFGPRETSLKAGLSMSWSFYLCHTISFNPPAEAFGDLLRQPDGSVRLNPLSYAPAKAPAPPPLSFDPNAAPIHFDAGKWDGKDFFNSGGICSLGQEDFVYKLTFAEPGTYQLRCLFRPFMQATITVVP
jgi:plastocyanin